MIRSIYTFLGSLGICMRCDSAIHKPHSDDNLMKRAEQFGLSSVCFIALIIQNIGSIHAMAHQATPASLPKSIATIVKARFEEPFIATGQTAPEEDIALATVLDTYSSQTKKSDLAIFEKYVHDYPTSGWRISLLANIGMLDYHFGYFSRALTAWQAAWEEGRGYTDPKIKQLVDRVAGEELRMQARLGHAQAIEALIADIGSRQLTGPATEELHGAKQGLWMMRNNPGVAYLCGPSALKSLLLAEGRSSQQIRLLDDVRSGPQGVSLAELANLAARSGLDYRLVYRKPNQPIPSPSIIHWKLNHFAAIIEVKDARFHIVDTTFGNDLWLSKDAVDAEGSGYFLIPANLSAAQWRPVSQAQAAAIRGM